MNTDRKDPHLIGPDCSSVYQRMNHLSTLISKTAFRFNEERTLQDGLELLLTRNDLLFDREVVLSPIDRIDFLVGGDIGIEVKVASTLTSVTRQLLRYTDHECVAGLILVTSRSIHKQVPTELGGKPVRVVHLLASIF